MPSVRRWCTPRLRAFPVDQRAAVPHGVGCVAWPTVPGAAMCLVGDRVAVDGDLHESALHVLPAVAGVRRIAASPPCGYHLPDIVLVHSVSPEYVVMAAEEGEYALLFQQLPEAIAILRIATEIVVVEQIDFQGRVLICRIVKRFVGGHEDMLNLRIGPRGIQIGFEPVVQRVADVGFSVGTAGLVADVRVAVVVLIQDHEVTVLVSKGIGGLLAVGRPRIDDIGKAVASRVESAKGGYPSDRKSWFPTAAYHG